MQNLAELCAIIIQNNLGELSAQIFKHIAAHGRAQLHTVRELTGLPLSRLQIGLSVLIQYHIVLHSLDDYDHSFFQVDWHSAYVLIRTEKIQRLVGERHGQLAAQIVDQVIQLGLVSVGDLAEEYTSQSETKRDSAVETLSNHVAGGQNGTAQQNGDILGDGTVTVGKLHETLTILLEHGFLLKVGDRSFLPAADLQQHMHDTVVRDQFADGRISGPKKQKEFRSALNGVKRRWQEEDRFSTSRDTESRGSVKRAKLKSGKYSRTNGGDERGANDAEFSGSKLPDGMVVRINYNKCIMALRTQRLELTASRYLGPVTAAVYGALLRVLEGKQDATRDVYKIEDEGDDGGLEAQPNMPLAYDYEVLEIFDQAIDLASSLGKERDAKMVNGDKAHGESHMDPDDATAPGLISDDSSDTEDGGDNGFMSGKQRKKRLAMITAHLQLLAEHPKGFCQRPDGAGKSSVDISWLTRSLERSELDKMIASRHGNVSARVVRMLREKGMLEEKQIAVMGMKRLKDARQVLTSLHARGLVEIQELPKDNTRQPPRSTYLWFFDESRVKSLYLQHVYRGIARLFQRMKAERNSDMYRTAVDKAERADVKGRETELLAAHERDLVKQWRDLEERMLIQISRLDDVVALLRDFSGKDTSLDT